MKLKKLLTTLLIASSISACSVPAPNTDICLTNVLNGNMKCYNLSRDYDADGRLKPNAQATYKPARAMSDMDKLFCTDANGFENLKIFSRQVRDQLNECSQ